jgi:hypothetical protein
VITDRADLVPAELRRAPVPAARMPQQSGTSDASGNADVPVHRTDAAAMLRESIASWSDEL